MTRFALFRHTVKLPLEISEKELQSRVKAFPLHPHRNTRPYEEGIIISETQTGFRVAKDSPDDKVSPIVGEAHPSEGALHVSYRNTSGNVPVIAVLTTVAAGFELFHDGLRPFLFILAYGALLLGANYLHFRLASRKITA